MDHNLTVGNETVICKKVYDDNGNFIGLLEVPISKLLQESIDELNVFDGVFRDYKLNIISEHIQIYRAFIKSWHDSKETAQKDIDPKDII